MSGIKFKNCYLEGNSTLELQTNVSNSTIATGGITFESCDFDSLADFFYAASDYANGVGCINLINSKFKSSGTQSLLSSKILANFRGNIGLMFKKTSTITTTVQTIIHTFPDLYFLVPHYGSGNTAGDTERSPDVTLYKDGITLIYGVDWFCDGSMATNKMDNRIRLYDSAKVPVGSKLTLVRNN
ncbi:hypothetical protein [Bacillus thuringiensis]|uniref:hypothetical protein n=2 Tax=Bacillus thuringiensis TaxID=1428 RepID=UPI00115E87D1|nr:hypothetical protein [Bacillus thuringiensis]